MSTLQVAHLALLSNFPFFSVSSPAFVMAVVMVLVNHYFAFSHFGEKYYPFSEVTNVVYSFDSGFKLLSFQVMAYFTLCMWLVPFAFFVSLSANENVLPTVNERRPLLSDDNDVVTNYFSKKQKGVGLLSMFNSVKDSLTPGKNHSY